MRRCQRELKALLLSSAVGIACGISAHPAQADPLPGEQLKFSQVPLNGAIVPSPTGLPYYGHDELSTATLATGSQPATYQGQFMADDFSDRVSSPVVHISWWGSYIQNQHFAGVNKFLIAFESDVPAGTASSTFSHPGTVLSSQVVSLGALAPLSGTFDETLQTVPPAGEALYRYNAELRAPFQEQANNIYWLKIVALVNQQTDGPIAWGWHDRDYTIQDSLAAGPPAVVPGERSLTVAGDPLGPVWHFQDDAVTGTVLSVIDPSQNVLELQQGGYAPQNYIPNVDGPTPIGQYSKDLAFQLFYVPEPGCMSVMALSCLLALKRRRA